MCLGTVRRALHDDLRILVGVYGMRQADIYRGAKLWRSLYTKTKILKRMQWQMGSQCSSIKIGVIWSCFFVLVTRWAATFCADCTVTIIQVGGDE